VRIDQGDARQKFKAILVRLALQIDLELGAESEEKAPLAAARNANI
jgi:hypothetical protein